MISYGSAKAVAQAKSMYTILIDKDNTILDMSLSLVVLLQQTKQSLSTMDDLMLYRDVLNEKLNSNPDTLLLYGNTGVLHRFHSQLITTLSGKRIIFLRGYTR